MITRVTTIKNTDALEIRTGDDVSTAVLLSLDDAVELLGRLTGLIPTMRAPELILAYTDPEDPADSYLCPHCGETHLFDQSEPSLIELDADVRPNDAHVGDEGRLYVSQCDQDYATMVFLCGYCRRPVSLPEDTPVDWS